MIKRKNTTMTIPSSRAILMLSALVLSVLSGCAGQQAYESAKKLWQLREFDEAVTKFEEAVMEDPYNEEYARLLIAAKKSAGELHLRNSRKAASKGDLNEAIAEAENAAKFRPGDETYSNELQSLVEKKESVRKSYAAAKASVEAGEIDKAADALKSISRYKRTFPDIETDLEKVVLESARIHTLEGEKRLESKEFDTAIREFEIALAKKPDFGAAKSGLQRAKSEKQAAALVRAAKSDFDAGKYETALAAYQKALKLIPNHPDAAAGVVKTKQAWAESLYQEAEKLEAKGGVEGYSLALSLLEEAESLIPGFMDVDAHTTKVKRELAALCYQKGVDFLQKGTAFAANALIYLRRAQHCDPRYMDLRRKLSQAKRAFDEKRRFYVWVDFLDDTAAGSRFASTVTNTLMAKISRAKIKDLILGDPRDRKNVAFVEVRGKVLQDESYVNDALVKMGRSQSIAGTRYVPNPEYIKVQRMVDQARRDLDDAQRRSAIYGNNYYSQGQSYGSSIPGFRIGKFRFNIYSNRYSSRYSNPYNNRYNSGYYGYSDVGRARRRLQNLTYSLNSTQRYVEETIYQDYTYQIYEARTTAKVKLSYSMADNEETLDRSVDFVDARKQAKDKYTVGIRSDDSLGLREDPKELPSSSRLQNTARVEAIDKLSFYVTSKLKKYNERFYEYAVTLGQQGRQPEAVENFLCYLYSTDDLGSPTAVVARNSVERMTHIPLDDLRQ